MCLEEGVPIAVVQQLKVNVHERALLCVYVYARYAYVHARALLCMRMCMHVLSCVCVGVLVLNCALKCARALSGLCLAYDTCAYV